VGGAKMRSSRENPLLSIVIPLYNSGKTIGKVLDSILKQEYPLNRIELILVYYPSQDNTFNVISSFKNKYSDKFYEIIIITRRDKRANYARNLGIRISRGKYVMLLNDDIVLPPKLISDAMSLLEENNSIHVLTYPYITDPPRLREKAMFHKYIGYIHKTRVLNLGCSIIRREVFEKIGFIREDMGPPISSNDDFEYSARIIRGGFNIFIDGRYIVKDIGLSKNEISDEYYLRGRTRSIIRLLLDQLRYDVSIGAKTYGLVLESAPMMWRIEAFAYILLPLSIFLLFNPITQIIFLAILLGLILYPLIVYPRRDYLTIAYFIITITRRITRSYGYAIYLLINKFITKN
jgi:glycosyltransferase involved in cell wall biosynthesis